MLHLREFGPTPYAFTLRTHFPPPEVANFGPDVQHGRLDLPRLTSAQPPLPPLMSDYVQTRAQCRPRREHRWPRYTNAPLYMPGHREGLRQPGDDQAGRAQFAVFAYQGGLVRPCDPVPRR